MTAYRTLGLAALLAATAGLSACQKQTTPPADAGICYHVVTEAGGALKYNVLARSQPRIENCAVELERMRLRFLSLGGSNKSVVGAFQGNFIWVDPRGVFISQTLEGHQYPSLFRGDDGRLVIPGAQPANGAAPAAQ